MPRSVHNRPVNRVSPPFNLSSEMNVMSSEVGMWRRSVGCTLTHFASRLSLGNVFLWKEICPSHNNIPFCMAQSNTALRGQSCVLAVADDCGWLAAFDPAVGTSGLDDFCLCEQVNRLAIYDLKWACDDSFIASASADGTVCLSSLSGPRLQPILMLQSSSNSHVKSISCHPRHSNLLASGTRDGIFSVWDTRSRSAAIQSIIRPEAPTAVSIAPTRSIRSSQKQSSQGVHSLTGLEYLNDMSIISSSSDGRVCLWDTRSFGRPVMIKQAMNGKLRALACVRVSPCRTRAAFLTANGYCCVQPLHNLDNGELCNVIPLSPDPALDFGVKLDWSPCGRFIACGCKDQSIHIVDMTLGVVALRMCGHEGAVSDVAWIRSRAGLLSLAADGQIRAWHPHMPPLRWDA
jgi:WD40 repeat protein